ncbi:hypothetical protein BU604_10920 [Staphylococcus arlettae]|uniref:hypothetical protein n=1 Tax=Staphylococcus arlettae TaxID=29378 RepID=UPI000E682B51|nr:hypothetical protein [Staphylococcus arlettae]RIM58352.1 hypothetical protein BU604_10920 [Staphylococcus arlettae]
MEIAIFTVLSSTVVAAIVTGIINKSLKIKELKTQVNLQENQEWIKNLDLAFEDFIEKSNKYTIALSRYLVNELDYFKLSDHIFSLNNSFYKIVFYLSQVEYSQEEVCNISSLIQSMIDENNELREKVLHYHEILETDETLETDENLMSYLENVEERMDGFSLNLAELLGEMISREKGNMIHHIIDSDY